MFPKKLIIWEVEGDLDAVINLLEEKVKKSRVLSFRCTAMELGPKFYISRKWPSMNPFAQTNYTEIVGEYVDDAVRFEVRENMVPSAFQVLGVFLVIFLAFVSIETSEWALVVVAVVCCLVMNAILYFHVRAEISYLERKLKELIDIE